MLWAIANEQQKTQLNEWYKLVVNPVIRLGITVPGSLLPTIIEYTSKPQTNSPEQREPERPIICGRVQSEEIDHHYRVYEWQDDNSQTQISDKPPTQDYSALRVQTLYVENFFDLSLDSSQAQLPAFLQNHIQAGVTKTYKTFSDVIKVAQLKKIHLNLKFISDKNQFHTYRMQVALDSSSKATGFYTSRLNQSTIWAVGDKHHMTRITLHEATHAMVASCLEIYRSGSTRAWQASLRKWLSLVNKPIPLPPITSIFSYYVIVDYPHFAVILHKHMPTGIILIIAT